MEFYNVNDLTKILNYSRSKVYTELVKWNATLKKDYGVKFIYPGRIRKDLFDQLTGPETKKELSHHDSSVKKIRN